MPPALRCGAPGNAARGRFCGGRAAFTAITAVNAARLRRRGRRAALTAAAAPRPLVSMPAVRHAPPAATYDDAGGSRHPPVSPL